ncbi:hypothetical protein B0H10DRAFT_2103697, partial [Mycena sp. CBHHK59/15]
MAKNAPIAWTRSTSSGWTRITPGARGKWRRQRPDSRRPIFISEDEFELVMALLEKFTDQQVLEGDGPDFALYRCLFL